MSGERLLGVRIEYPETNRAALAGVIIASWLYHLQTGFKVMGQLPKDGPAIVVANHTSTSDIMKMARVCFSIGRVIRGVARESLLYPNIKDHEDVLERTGKKDGFDPMRLPLIAHTLAFTLRGIGAIPVTRGENRDPEKDRQFLRACDEVLKSGQMLGMFIQETRVAEGDLRNLMPGVGILARRHSDIPIIPVGIWSKCYKSRKVVIGEPFTYNRLVEQAGHKLGAKETTALIGDQIAELLPWTIQTKWIQADRPQFTKRN